MSCCGPESGSGPFPHSGPRQPGEFTIGKDARSRPKNLRRDAAEWIKNHRDAIALFFRFAAEAASKGRKFGIGLITERVRWETLIFAGREDPHYKISNSYRAYIARHLIKVEPYLEDFLTFRNVKYNSEEGGD